MRVMGFPAGMFQTNCYLIAHDDRPECVVIDPGQDALPAVKQLLGEHGLEPVAVLLTHGHLDHMWTAQPLCDEFGIPLFIHPDDRPMLTDPASGIGPTLSGFIQGIEFVEPGTVKELNDGDVVELAGIEFVIDHTPGHTRGSVTLRTRVASDDADRDIVFSGDTLFAGSIGRSDLPGGDADQLIKSIVDRLMPLADDTMILPGHGEVTTVGQERRSNPFLR
ncbi:MBL fold metallo-hydrolase [Hoyosella rhizosphaerae]|uniref:Metallo-beta-lactamase domain-containing protein n=1 Tax=Hoyosella rhizosphaerae TaxID=1755582 RepID=A0A916XAD9_9ACTN|nr:MBL fold metallo-hydrolase [Hoyosella rhizosphaerae]MBN4926428.1 MBL fold metallo-hydrolase [Hoyosella rhizosphaerae]GGC59429.1 hypothetical protein GCM10011410_09840 [Hoyosella rhizosphaerae]